MIPKKPTEVVVGFGLVASIVFRPVRRLVFVSEVFFFGGWVLMEEKAHGMGRQKFVQFGT